MSATKGLSRCCLVTVGATVGFRKLTAAVLEPDFWRHLSSHGFTELRVQCGPDEAWASAKVESQKGDVPANLAIEVFASRNNLLMEEMTRCKAVKGQRSKGLIIGHAGKGAPLISAALFKSNELHRYWYYIGCMEARCANDCRTKHGPFERSPNGDGQAPGKGGLCHISQGRVSSRPANTADVQSLILSLFQSC